MMDLLQAIKERHSVRDYTEQALEAAVIADLQAEVADCNQESGLHLQLVTDEPRAFSGLMARTGKFKNVRNYLALVGPKGPELEQKLGYYGQRVALRAQQLGLNSCWVALTYSKGKCQCVVAPGEKLVCVLALGYGRTPGVAHQSKPLEQLCRVDGAMPQWFKAGMEAALLAPTAVNQQKFLFTLQGESVQAEATGGFYSQVDLGIVQYHFEIGAGRENFQWLSAANGR